ncbi:hypothetical protein SSCG_00581 [Streptomyces clavuligerus]|nr:hypothetical protein SSCG_00581 [Streptomyces clavuligerus]
MTEHRFPQEYISTKHISTELSWDERRRPNALAGQRAAAAHICARRESCRDSPTGVRQSGRHIPRYAR